MKRSQRNEKLGTALMNGARFNDASNLDLNSLHDSKAPVPQRHTALPLQLRRPAIKGVEVNDTPNCVCCVSTESHDTGLQWLPSSSAIHGENSSPITTNALQVPNVLVSKSATQVFSCTHPLPPMVPNSTPPLP